VSSSPYFKVNHIWIHGCLSNHGRGTGTRYMLQDPLVDHAYDVVLCSRDTEENITIVIGFMWVFFPNFFRLHMSLSSVQKAPGMTGHNVAEVRQI